MHSIIGPDGLPLMTATKMTEDDRIINAFYCGQIQSLHYLMYYIFRAKQKYDLSLVFRFIEARYCYLIQEYPNYYNQLHKNDKELGAEAEHHYKKILDEMLKFFKSVPEKDANVGKG